MIANIPEWLKAGSEVRYKKIFWRLHKIVSVSNGLFPLRGWIELPFGFIFRIKPFPKGHYIGPVKT